MLAFLEGELNEAERERLLDEVLADPVLTAELRQAAAGLDAMHRLRARPASQRPDDTGLRRSPVRTSAWWAVAAAAATLAIAVPATWGVARTSSSGAGVPLPVTPAGGQPESPQPSFLLVLQGRWPDVAEVAPAEAQRRAREYWSWTTGLAEQGILVAAGDLRWEPGQRVTGDGTAIQVAAEALDDEDYVVGMFAIRAGSYDEALRVARECPHLEYGGTVAVRQVGSGFVTAAGFGDWEPVEGG